MEPPELPHPHKKMLHGKRAGKYPPFADSPAYDASEEDNDPLTDDGGSTLSLPVSRNQHVPTSPLAQSRVISGSSGASAPNGTGYGTVAGSTNLAAGRTIRGPSTGVARHHHFANVLSESDDGVDSPTYDGDVESSTTAGGQEFGTLSRLSSASTSSGLAPAGSSTSTLTSPTSGSFDASASMGSSILNMSISEDLAMASGSTIVQVDPPPAHSQTSIPTSATPPNQDIEMTSSTPPSSVPPPAPLTVPEEPSPAAVSVEKFDPAKLTTEDIQTFVQRAIIGEEHRPYKINPPPVGRPVRIYADGVYDLFHFGHALQLRQAKCSFPSVYLLAGVNSDEQVWEHKARTVMIHAERCEAVRHCRWVDQVVSDAPWVIDGEFLEKYQIDYVAHDEDPYVSGNHDDVYGYVKSLGKFIPTRRTPGVSTSELLERIVSGYRNKEFDKKLEKMGHAELKAEGSDFDDSPTGSRAQSRTRGRRAAPSGLSTIS